MNFYYFPYESENQPRLCFYSVRHTKRASYLLHFVNSNQVTAQLTFHCVTLSWRKPLSYRNKSIDLQSKSIDWFLYDNGLRHERVKVSNRSTRNTRCEIVQSQQWKHENDVTDVVFLFLLLTLNIFHTFF